MVEGSPPDGVARQQPVYLPHRRQLCAHTAAFHTPHENSFADGLGGGGRRYGRQSVGRLLPPLPRGGAGARAAAVRDRTDVAQRGAAQGAARRGRVGAPL